MIPFDPIPFVEELRELAQWEDRQRFIESYAVVHKALQAAGYMTPVLTGGLAVEYYTRSAYKTTDIDALLFTPSEIVDATMTSLGFQKVGCGWRHREFRLFVEFPGNRSGHPNLKTIRVPMRGTEIEIEGIEYAIINRVNYFAEGRPGDGVDTLTLLRSDQKIDWELLERLAEEEQVTPLLEGIMLMAGKINWANPPSTSVLKDQLFYLLYPHRIPIMEEDETEEPDHERET